MIKKSAVSVYEANNNKYMKKSAKQLFIYRKDKDHVFTDVFSKSQTNKIIDYFSY